MLTLPWILRDGAARRGVLLAIVSSLALALAAGCGGGSAPTETATDPAPAPAPTTSPPAPGSGATTVLARMVLEDDSPATGLLADLPGGGKADLGLPRYAVRERVEITLSSLPATLALPTGSVAGGVRLQPDGLQLGGAAVLTLHVPGTLEQAKTLGFAIHAGVVTYHPVKVRHYERNGIAFTSVDIPLQGFSDHGVVSNADPALIAQAIGITTPPLELLYARLSSVSQDSAVALLLADFFHQQVEPALLSAATLPEHPLNLETAMRLYLAWRDQLTVMGEIHPALGTAGIDPDHANTLLADAITRNIDHWNDRCKTTFDPADARQAVTSWLWAPSVFLDRNAPLRKTDLQAKLCLAMDISAEIDALLESDQARPLLIKTGLQVLAQPRRHDVPVRVRTLQVQGGSVGGTPALTDAQGEARLSATVQGDNPGLAVELNAGVVGFADVLDRTVRVFRPRNGGQPKLISGKKFSGVVKHYFDRTPPECRQGREPGLEYIGEQSADLFIAGDPFAYVATLKEQGIVGGGVPPPDWVGTLWEFHGRGDFGSFGGNVFSIETASGVQRVTDPFGYLIAGWSMGFAMSGDSQQRLTGRFSHSCQHRELDMLPAVPGP